MYCCMELLNSVLQASQIRLRRGRGRRSAGTCPSVSIADKTQNGLTQLNNISTLQVDTSGAVREKDNQTLANAQNLSV